MGFKFNIGGRLYDAVYDDFSFLVERGSIGDDNYLEGLISTFEISDLELYGEDYTHMKSLYDEELGCGQVAVTIVEDCCTDYKYQGSINLADVKLHPIKCKAIVQVTDAGYGAYIKQSKSIAINLGTSKHRDGTPMTGIDFVSVTLNHPLPDRHQLITTKTVNAYKISDVADLMIRWVSNGDITLSSTLLSPLSGSEYYITSGYNLNSSATKISPSISFECLLKTIKVLFNANWSVNNESLIIEDIDFFFNNTIFKATDKAKDLIYGQCEDFLYSSVEIGDEEALSTYDDGGTTLSIPEGEGSTIAQTGYLAMPQTELGGFVRADLAGDLECSSGTTLSLTSDCIHWDSNLIEHLAFSNLDQILEDSSDRLDLSFILEIDVSTLVNVAGSITYSPYVVQTSALGYTRAYFNPSLTNENILSRWDGFIPSSLETTYDCDSRSDSATVSNSLIASSIEVITVNPISFPLIFTSATNGLYDTTSGKFTPSAAGFYDVCANVWINIANPQGTDLLYQVGIDITKGSFAQSLISPQVTAPAAETGDFNFKNSGAQCTTTPIYIDSSFTISASIIISATVSPANDLWFTLNNSTIDFEYSCNDEFTSSEPQRKTCSTFTTLESSCDFQTILSNTDKNMSINGLPFYIKRLTRDAKTGVSDWEGLY
jgi:hypothetical protein